MMLHRHFEKEKSKNVTTLKDVTPTEQPKEEKSVEAKRPGRPKKTEE